MLFFIYHQVLYHQSSVEYFSAKEGALMPGSSTIPATHLHLKAANAQGGETRLQGPWLRVIQGIWLVLVLIDLATLLISLPVYYQTFFTACIGPITSCPDTGQLSVQTLPVLQQAGFSLDVYGFYVLFLDLLTTLPFLLVGALIAWRRATTWMGLFVSFLLINMGSLGLSFAHIGVLNESSNPLIIFLNVADIIPVLLYYPCLSFFFSTFPDGRFVPRWSWALIVLWIVNVFFWIAPTDTPFNLGNWPPLLEAGWLSVVFGGSACTQLYRFLRAASPLQRQQIKWLLYGFVPVIVAPLCLTLYMTFVPALNQPGAFLVNTPNAFLLVVALPLYRFWYLPVPFCIGIALLRYRLWDIDVLINRTLVYGLLTATLLGIYLVLVFGGESLLANIFGPGDAVVLVVSTLIVAALFQPLRRWVQQLVDRRFYRSKYDAALVVTRFGETLHQEVNLEQLRGQLLAVVQETVQPASLSLWLCLRNSREESEKHGTRSPLL